MDKLDFKTAVREAVQQELGTFLCQEIGQGYPPTPPETTKEPPKQANAVTETDLKRAIAEALKEYDPPARNTRAKKRRRTDKPKEKAQAIIDGVPVTYCYTHGVTSNLNHHSGSCQRRCKGHDKTATFDDRKGGSNATCKRE